MVSNRKLLLLSMLILPVMVAWGDLNVNKARVGYLYPAGARQGQTIMITAGGQFLRGANNVYITGDGVSAKVVKFMRPTINLNKERRDAITYHMKEVENKRISELPTAVRAAVAAKKKAARDRRKANEAKKKKAGASRKVEEKEKEEPKLPPHPLFYDFENKSLRELAHIKKIIYMPRNKRQINRQISEAVLIEVTIAPDAKPGPRELRIRSRNGLTNPIIFQVGSLPEAYELEPNDQKAYQEIDAYPNLPKPKALELPVVLNGQIMPGDVDRFRFKAKKGQQIVIEAHARSLIPYLADAVPGWFQATVALYESGNNEVAYADDFRFSPDPVLVYTIPKDSEYELEIRDSIYRGREDFVYRVIVGQCPFITQMFPLGGSEGVKTVAAIDGWNLTKKELTLDTKPNGGGVRKTMCRQENLFSNFVPYAIDTLPECSESESNNSTKNAQKISLPKIVNGRISKTDDVDIFQFQGRAGDEVVAEIHARRLNSPLDSILRLMDASGKVLQWNDDYVLKDKTFLHTDDVGLVTHHADSYLMAKLDKDGTYYVHLTDSQNHGGPAYAYRLHVSVAQPDFALRVTPSSLNMLAGRIVPITVHALRKDGFNGPIEVAVQDAASGFNIGGGRIPAGSDRVRMTLTAPDKAPDKPISLKLEGRAKVGENTISRLAVPADDVMQAFLFRHLVPAQDLMVAVRKNKWKPLPVKSSDGSPVEIPLGGSVQVQLKTTPRPILKEIRLDLYEPPEGITLDNVTVVPEGLAFVLKADKEALKAGFEDNLIVEAFRQYRPKQKDGKLGKQRRDSLGAIPAVPIRIVDANNKKVSTTGRSPVALTDKK